MSYEFPFSKPAGWSVQKVFLLALITVHAIWIIIHLNLVSREVINPWKLGGYGMYTTVHASAVLYVFDSRFGGLELPPASYNRRKVSRQNRFFIFRCQPMTVASVKTFFKDNPRLVGIPLRFIVTERHMLRDPIRAERLPHAILEVRWTGKSTFDYAGKVCGKLFRGEAELKP